MYKFILLLVPARKAQLATVKKHTPLGSDNKRYKLGVDTIYYLNIIKWLEVYNYLLICTLYNKYREKNIHSIWKILILPATIELLD